MRKINTIVVLLIMVLLLDHALFASLNSVGIGNGVIPALAHTFLTLVLIHALISLLITIRAEKAGFVTGARYNKENAAFWNRRVTGVAILVLAITHASLMQRNETGRRNIASMPKIFEFTLPLLIVCVYLHVLSNIRPLLIALGARNIDKKEKIIKVLFSVFMLLALLASIYRAFFYSGGHH